MGCMLSKESASSKPKRAILYGSDTSPPNQRYLSDPPRKNTASNSSTKVEERGSGEAARPKETFEAYARRGIIRQSALTPEDLQPGRKKHLSQKRVGGYEKYTRE